MACTRSGHHRGQRALHHGAVGRIEAGLVADLGHTCISDVSIDRGQQALYLGGRGFVFLEPADFEQVL